MKYFTNAYLVLAEKAALKDCTEAFSKEMYAKLLQKQKEGHAGWDDKHFEDTKLFEMLLEHAGKGDMVDVAILAMFLWNREPENEDGKK